MAIAREFLGMQQPALLAAADYLVDRFGQRNELDLRDVLLVLPGGRAGRRLLEILVDRAAAQRWTLTPPQCRTVGQLPELLYQVKKPFADDLVQQLAWADSLRKHEPAKLTAVLAQRPADGDAERWLGLGRLLQTLHRELASDGLDFSHVLQQGATLPGFAEAARWQALAEIQQRYLRTLDDLGLWDRQTARLFAIEHRECRVDQPVVLLAAVDMNQSMRRMLDQVSDQVTALIYAPPEWADRFDSHGCLIPEAWQDVDLNIPDDSLRAAANPAEQSELVAHRLAEYNGRFGAEEITIGLADERIVPQLVRQLDECGLPNRFGPGQPVSRTCVYRMLQNLAALAGSGRYAELAALVRHPDVEAWLLRGKVKPGWIEELDRYYNEHLPTRIEGTWLGDEQSCRQLKMACERVQRLTRPLQGPPRRLVEWLPDLGRIVLEVYGGRNFDLEREADRVTWKACSIAQDALGELARIPDALMPVVGGPEAVQVLLNSIYSQRIAPTAAEAAIELVGWLELPLDDAPALMITSFNEGLVPSSVNADMFLPGALRSTLGLDDNPRRYARDAYAVATLLAPWRDTTFFILQRSHEDDPLSPSRLLFAAPPETVARRSLRFFGEGTERPVRQPLAGALSSARTEAEFDVPRPSELPESITRMSVTSFRTYLACPYRFYLSYVLKLSCVDDDAKELDGAGFGNLAHAVLEQFGHSDVRDSVEAETIEAELNQMLDASARQRFGNRPGAALRVQIEQLRLRLGAFARWQASQASAGWRIERAEQSFDKQPGQLDVDGKPMLLTGRIDRIDVHEATGQRRILDYKTSDAGDPPAKTHRKRSGEWIDLQLPLYRHLARALDIQEPVGLGYIVLPKSLADVGLATAEWTDADLQDADRTACEVVRRIRKQVFWPPTEPPPDYSEDFAAICMDGVFGRKKSS